MGCAPPVALVGGKDMSIFTAFVSKVLDQVPGAPGATVTVRKLAPARLAEAQSVQQLAAVAQMRKMREAMGPEMMESITKVAPAQIAEAKAADPLLSYDRVELMRAGITAWSFDVALSAEVLADMDDDAQTYIAGEILRLSKPSLYLTPAEDQADQKNG